MAVPTLSGHHYVASRVKYAQHTLNNCAVRKGKTHPAPCAPPTAQHSAVDYSSRGLQEGFIVPLKLKPHFLMSPAEHPTRSADPSAVLVICGYQPCFPRPPLTAGNWGKKHAVTETACVSKSQTSPLCCANSHHLYF